MASTQGVQGGRSKATLIRSREEAVANLSRQKFFNTDRVKEFHRQLMLTQTLKERDEQVRQKQKIINGAKEENRRILQQIKLKEVEALEQDRQRAKQREQERKTIAEYLQQQMKESELINKEKKLEKEREAKEWQQIQEQYAKEVKMQRQEQQDQKTKTRNVYTAQILTWKAIAAREAKQKDMEEKRQKQYVRDKDNWTTMVRDIEADRQVGLQKRKDIVAEKLALQMQEDLLKKEQQDVKAVAGVLAQQETKRLQAVEEANQKRKAVFEEIAAQRENKRREIEQITIEEKKRDWNALQASKEVDRAYWANEQQTARKKREELACLNEARRQQMAEKRAKEELQKKEQMEFDLRSAQLMCEEDKQFEQYTAAVISAVSAAEGNTFPLCEAARKGMGGGFCPISGRLKTNYLVPGATPVSIPDYTRNIARYSRANDDFQSTKSRLGFEC